MEEIVNRHMKTEGIVDDTAKDDGDSPSKEPETPEPSVAAAPEQPKLETPAQPTPTQAAQPVPEPPKPETVKVKVDGQEFDVPKADVEAAGGITAYQKDRAAENRLKKANETLAETRRTQAALAKWLEQQQVATAKPAAPVQSDDEFIQNRIQLINFGTPEEQRQAAQELRSKLNPQLDQNAIIRQTLIAVQQDAAERQFVNEFSDVVHNPLLLKLIIQMKSERLAQLKDAPPDWSMFYRTIGNEVRGAIGRQSQPAQPSTTSPTSPVVDKEARKADIVNLPTAAARAELPKEEKPESREDILNQMRKARGFKTG
jgi:hypothetical protein